MTAAARAGVPRANSGIVIEKTILPNGVRVLTERIPGSFSVTMGLWVEVGSRDEDPPRSGISHFIEHMAFKGTERRSPLDIAREIDRLGGQANAFTSKENTCFHARALASRLPELSDLLMDLLLRPAYNPDELERERSVILQEISYQEDTPDDLVHVLFGQNFWPSHPLGRPVLGYADSVSSMDRETLLDYQNQHYQPEGLVVASVGNLEHQQVVDLVSEPLGKLPMAPRSNNRQAPSSEPGLHVVPRPLEQVHMVLGHPAPSAVDPDRFTAALLNLILGGNMSSRLFQEVREKRGLAYSVYSFLSAYSDSGALGIYLGVSPDRAAEALRVACREVQGLAGGKVSDEELADAKENLKGSILLSVENPETRMSRLARNEINFGRDMPIEDVVARVEAVSAQDVSDLAAKLLAPDKLSATVLGAADADELAKEMGS
jgi:predicted Zn-dependent peptidase